MMILLTLMGCKEEKERAQDGTQMREVMAIHDEAMPKMGTISNLVSELKVRVDTTEMGRKYDDAMKELQASHEKMMNWMQGFGNRFDSDEILNGKELTEQKQRWLAEEEVKIRELNEQIDESIQRAEELLKEE